MLATLPVELETREPSHEALEQIRKFAKLTGDLPALSAVDKRVLALAWMLEKETKGGVAHLRTTPPPPRAQGPRRRETPADDTASEATASEALGEDVTAGHDEEMADHGEEDEMEDAIDNEPCAVVQGLFLGGVDAAGNVAALEARGITHLLTVAAELPTVGAILATAAQAPGATGADASPGAAASQSTAPSEAAGSAVPAAAEALGRLTRLHVPLEAEAEGELAGALPACFEFIRSAKAAGGAVLVHGVAGRSRAPAVVAAFLMGSSMHVSGGAALVSVADAMATISAARPWVDVSPALMRQLGAYEAQLREEAGVGARSSGGITSSTATCASATTATTAATASEVGCEAGCEVGCEVGSGVVDICDTPHHHDNDHHHDHGAPSKTAEQTSAAFLAVSAAAARREARARAEAAEAAVAADGDVDIPWITVDNLKQMQMHDSHRASVPDERTTVACLTTDYAMQSVLMQMGMQVVGADGLLMRSIKQWVLKCSACNTQQPDLDRSFCTKCGNSSLVRLVSIIDVYGAQRILPERGAPARVRSTNIRGTKFPMPKPKTGRHANNLILAEDSLAEATDKFRKQGKARVEDVFDQDYSLDDHFGRSGKKGGGSGGTPRVGYGKRANPNDVRSRPKRT